MRTHNSVYDDPPATTGTSAVGDDQPADAGDSTAAPVREREIVRQLNELDERPAEEAGYGHGV